MSEPSTAIVPADTELACVPKTKIPLVLSFMKGMYGVPEKCIVSAARKANVIESPEALGQLLASKAPDKWKQYCDPDTIWRFKGEEGNCCYTTFKVTNGQGPDEERHLHLIAHSIAHKNFPAVKKELIEVGRPHAAPEQSKRWQALDWTKEENMPKKNQINPELNHWPTFTSEEVTKSCAKMPEQKKRPKGPHDRRSREEEHMMEMRAKFIKTEAFIDVGPKGTYAIREAEGLVHVVQYNYNEENGEAEEGAAAGDPGGADENDEDVDQ